MDIHFAAAISTIEQARQRCNIAPAIGITAYLASDFLCKVKGLLVNDGFMGILKNRPFVLRHIMAFLILEMLSGLEIDGVSQILTLIKNVADGGRTPAVNIFESLVFVHTLVELCQICRGNEYLFLFQPVCYLIRSHALNRH